jgi:asparagine synthase (glutamine-hydrolysing)
MCAIAGVVGLPANQGVIDRMLETMKRRGPDENASCTIQDCTLIHSRLAIIDPEGGAQPMTLVWAGKCYWLVYNGELYNTLELRGELSRLGHCFCGHSDTEVLLHGYAQWGTGVLERLNGIFAFAVWEEKERRLFIARDRMGVKPLFYSAQGGGLIFASEIKTLLAYPAVHPRLDTEGAAQILLFGPGRIPGSGVFKGINELEPGTCGYFDTGKLNIWHYWRLKDREHSDDFGTTVSYVRYLVEDAIKRQMVSDVPIGCFLSGGLDSSIISAVCSQELDGQLDTFSVDYRDNDRYFQAGKYQPNTDRSYIEQMCSELRCTHRWTVLEQDRLLGCLEDATCARDLPGMADVDFSLLAFCGEIRKHVKVALSGECADEIFGGYPWYRDPLVREMDGFPWAQNTKERVLFLSESLKSKIDGVDFVYSQYRLTLDQSDILPETTPLERRMKQMMNLNLRWFMQTLLDRKDRMSMYHGLEVRVPFCDHRIAEYLYGVPWDYKDYRGREKGLLREAVKDLLPEQVLWRKKSPYPKTHHPQYAAMVRTRLEALLRKPDAALFSLVSKKALSRLLDAPSQWPWYGQLMTGPQTMAYFLQLQFWLEHYEIDIL